MNYDTEQMRDYMRKRRAIEKANRPDDWVDGRRKYTTAEEAEQAIKQARRLSVKKWRKNNPRKARAQWRLNKAVQRGTVQRPDQCSICGKVGEVHGHHHDYSKPFDVIWVCCSCHHGIHNAPLDTAPAITDNRGEDHKPKGEQK